MGNCELLITWNFEVAILFFPFFPPGNIEENTHTHDDKISVHLILHQRNWILYDKRLDPVNNNTIAIALFHNYSLRYSEKKAKKKSTRLHH